MENGGLEYKIGLDTSQLMRDINTAKKGFDSLTNEAISQGNEIEAAFDNVGQRVKNVIGSIAGITVGVTGFKQIVSSIASTRSYFQDIESSMKVFLGSAEKASEFTAELKDYAWYNMFEFSDLAGASKQLIAYGNSVETVIPTLDKLSNIAAGTGGDLQHFVDMFNRAKSNGQVMAKDMISWASSGVVLKDVLKDMGETVSGTSITFDQLNRALDHVTGEGGMFHNLMGEQMENLSSWWGALQDDMSTMLNDLGTKLQDPMTDAMKVAHNLLDNYEDVLQVLKEVAIAFGTVKTASVLEDVYGKLKGEADALANYTEQGKALEEIIGKERLAEVQKQKLTEGTKEYVTALQAQANEMMKAADLELKSANEAVKSADSLIDVRQQEVNLSKIIESNAQLHLDNVKKTGDAVAVEAAQRELEVAAMNRQAAEGKLVTAQEQKETAVRRKNTAAINQETIAGQLQSNAENGQAVSTNILTAAKMRLIGVFNKLKAAMLANPFTAVAAAVTALAYGIYKLVTYETEAEKTQRELNEALEEMDNQQKKESTTINLMFDRLKQATKGTQEYADAKAAIIRQYGSYLEGQKEEVRNLEDIAAAYEVVTAAALKSSREKKIAQVNDTASDELVKARDIAHGEAKKALEKYYKGQKDGEELVKNMLASFNTFLESGVADGQLKDLLDVSENQRKKLIGIWQERIEKAKARGADQHEIEVLERQMEYAQKSAVWGPLDGIINNFNKTKEYWKQRLEEAKAEWGTPEKKSTSKEWNIEDFGESLEDLMKEARRFSGTVAETGLEGSMYDPDKLKIIIARIHELQNGLKNTDAIEAQSKRWAEFSKQLNFDNVLQQMSKNEIWNLANKISPEGREKFLAEMKKLAGETDDILFGMTPESEQKAAESIRRTYENAVDKINAEQKAKEKERGGSLTPTEYAYYEAQRNAALQKMLDDMEKYGDQLQDKARDAEFAATEASINAMVEGTEKEIAQIKLDYEKKKEELLRQERDLKNKQNGVLTDDQQERIATERNENEVNREVKLNDLILTDYERFLRDKKKLDADYEAKSLLIKKQGINVERRLRENEENKQKATADLQKKYNIDILKDSVAIAKAMEKAGQQTKKSLRDSITTLKAIRDYKQGDKDALKGTDVTEEDADQLNVEQLKLIYEQLIEVQDEYEKRTQYPFKNLISGFKKLADARREFDKGNEKESGRLQAQGLSMVQTAAGNAAQAFSSAANAISQIADTIDDTQLRNKLKGVSESMSFLSDVGSGFASGGVWGAVAAAGSNIINQITNDAVEKAKKEAQAKAELIDYQKEYNKLLGERNYLESDYKGFLGEDKLGYAQAAYKEAKHSLEEYDKFIKQRAEKGGKNDAELTMQLFGFSGNPLEGLTKNLKLGEDKAWKKWVSLGMIGSTSTLASDMQKAHDRGLNNLQAQMIQRQERKWWKIGSKDRYTTLFDIAPELWGGDQNGEFDTEAARAFLETHKELDEVVRKNIEQAIEWKDAEEAALEKCREIAAEITGNMSDKMTDAIVNSVENGADAWGDFESAGSDAIKALGKEMVQSLIYQNYMKKYEEDIAKAIGEGDNEGVMKIIGDIGNEMPQMYAAGQALLKTVYDKGEEIGYQMYNIEQQNREAQQKGIAQASQDSIDELNGRMTAVQGHTFAISQNTATLTQHTAQILRVLNGISTDTARLENIEANIVAMRSDMSNINNRGVIVRQ